MAQRDRDRQRERERTQRAVAPAAAVAAAVATAQQTSSAIIAASSLAASSLDHPLHHPSYSDFNGVGGSSSALSSSLPQLPQLQPTVTATSGGTLPKFGEPMPAEDDETTRKIRSMLGDFKSFAETLLSSHQAKEHPSALGISSREVKVRKVEQIFNEVSTFNVLFKIENLHIFSI